MVGHPGLPNGPTYAFRERQRIVRRVMNETAGTAAAFCFQPVVRETVSKS